ncbi:hypothetical protein D3C86_1302610 [compost metagenome]
MIKSKNMKRIKSILLAGFGFFAIGGMVLSSSCEQDPCTTLLCQNGGSCTDGLCQCPTGYEGAECEIKTASRFVGKYRGTTRCTHDNVVFPITADSVEIKLVQDPNKISLVMYAGNTSIAGFEGTADNPNTTFNTFNNGVVSIHPTIQIDGNLIYVYLESLTLASGERQHCKFTGMKDTATAQ